MSILQVQYMLLFLVLAVNCKFYGVTHSYFSRPFLCTHQLYRAYKLLPILYVLVNLFSCINEDILHIISTEEARYVTMRHYFIYICPPTFTTGMVIRKAIVKILQNIML